MIYPMFSMVMLTLLVLGYTAFVRVRALKKHQVDVNYFKLMSGSSLPDYVAQAGRHFSNLMETPTLFYIAGVLIIVMQAETTSMLMWSWFYVGCRVVHALIHISYNNPVHRMVAFMLSIFCLLIIWINLVLHSQSLS